MKVKVCLLVNLKKHSPTGESEFCLSIEDGATVEKVFKRLHIPTEPMNVILVDGRQARLDDTLRDGNLIAIFPPVAGG
jgi:molybdopterin synthase sulfur carrier subunit